MAKKKETSKKKVEIKTPSVLTAKVKTADVMSTESQVKRLGLQFNLISVLIVVLFIFQIYTYYQVRNISKNVVAGGNGTAVESPLSQDNLIKYADEIGINKKDFTKCLESGEATARVEVDSKQGAELGVQGTPGFFINGKFLGGAFPIETFREIIDKELDGSATGNCTDYSEQLQTYCADENNQAFKPLAVNISLGDSPSIGPKDAPVTIIEFSDFECPFCARAYTTVKQIQQEYADSVKVVYKQLPLTNLHPNAQKAAEASVCADDQRKFWKMHDKMFESQGA